MSDEDFRVPPQAIEAERSILGAMMIENRHIDAAANWLQKSDFYRQDHQLIFETIIKLDSANSPADVVTVSESLSECDQIDQAGGLSYLVSLAKDTPNTGNISAYAKIVREKSKYRKIIENCSDTINRCYEPDSAKPEEIINEVSLSFDALDRNSSAENESGMRDLLSLALDGIEKRSNSKDQLLGYPTGLTDLDQKMGGLQRGHLVVVAGRPSMGKSCFSLAICDPALEQGAHLKVFALEMSRSEVSERNLSRWSGVDFGRIRNAHRIESDDWPRLTSSVGHWNSKSLSVDDSSNLNINQIRARCRIAKRKQGLDIVVIDYLGLMHLRHDVNKTEAIGEVTRALKIMSKELDCCVVLLSQLNRGLESRPNKRPVMSDLRDSGAIEQDADQIIFLYRDEVYNANTDYKGVCEIDLQKYRNGETGVTRVRFEGHLQRYLDFSSVAQFPGSGLKRGNQ